MRHLYLAILLAIPRIGSSQNIVFNEDFKDNSNKWQIESLDQKERASISSGRYDIETLDKNNWHYFTIEVPLDEAENFSIETLITKLPKKPYQFRFDTERLKLLVIASLRLNKISTKYPKSATKGLDIINEAQLNGFRYEISSDYNTYKTHFTKEEKYNDQDVSNAIGFIIREIKNDAYVFDYGEHYGLIWGCDGNTRLFTFLLQPEMKRFSVLSLINGTWTNLVKSTWVKETINSGSSSNKLTVANIDGTLHFLINDNLVGKAPFQSFYGNKIGFYVGPETHVSVDNLVVKDYGSSINETNLKADYKSSGTGFLISSKGYFVTNHHVISDAKEIWIEANINNQKRVLKAKVEIMDKDNDLAILKVDGQTFSQAVFGFKTQTVDVGSSVFAMGYPLLSVLGDELKITDGIVSSKTGYQGDISTYQISAPIQPGNSGGPLFDKKGYLVGVTNAGVPGADNVGYAIKASYLQNLIELLSDRVELPTSSKLENSIFTEQIKELSKFVVVIKIK